MHGLSNHVLDEPWPKVVRGRVAMELALYERDPVEPLFRMLSDRDPAPDAELPHTGVGVEWERRLSPPLIAGTDYGTRASTVMTVAASGEVRFEERSLSAAGDVTGTARERFALDQPAAIASG